MDAELECLTERLGNRIQSFHDLIGLDSKLLSESERLNAKGMYRIYADKKLPEDRMTRSTKWRPINEPLRCCSGSSATNPELVADGTALPDGIRSALQVERRSHDADGSGVRLQNVLADFRHRRCRRCHRHAPVDAPLAV